MAGDQGSHSPETGGGYDELATFVRSCIDMMKSGNIARLKLEHGDLRLSLLSHKGATSSIVTMATPRNAVAESDAAAPAEDDGLYTVTAPMIGTFYVAPAPNEPPFVKAGDRIEEGQTVGIIEAMKIMNEIAADRAGVVTDIVARNAQTVEYGSPLVKIRPDSQA